jgi:hypothetical protein
MAACQGGDRHLRADVSDVPVGQVKIQRYDLALFSIDTTRMLQELQRLQRSYPFFLGTAPVDPAGLGDMRAYLTSPRNSDFFQATRERFRETRYLEEGLTQAFKHVKYHFPNFRVPRVYSYISGGDYDYPVRYADSVLIIGLDNYLGSDFEPYRMDGLPVYRMERMTADHIIPDCMRRMTEVLYPAGEPSINLLGQMVEAGKRLYVLEAILPETEVRFITGYTLDQQAWVEKNEVHVWATMIEHRMLYSTDGQLMRTFLADGPFSAEFSQQAPPRLGEWLGFQIVRQYMARYPDVTITALMAERDAQKILSQSGYKPEK